MSGTGRDGVDVAEVPSLSAEAEGRIETLKRSYPDPRSAIMPAMYIAQEHFGYINDDAVQWVAARIGVAPVHVMEVATFYTMYYKKPVGRYHLQLCRTLSCDLCGARPLIEHVRQRLGVKAGEVTKDGMWSFEEVECLGSCGTAPMAEINDVYFEKLDPKKLDTLMDRIEREKPDLRFSTTKDRLGEGMGDHPRSEVI